MTNKIDDEYFGDWPHYSKARNDLLGICRKVIDFPLEREHERNFILAVARRTLSLEMSFKQAIDSQNGQMAMTMVRLNLDTLARFYALYWADKTKGMSAETFARDVASGINIRKMKFLGSNKNASDQWLIQKIAGLEAWIPKVYETTCGAIHFSDFHITQLLQQFTSRKTLDDGSLKIELRIGAIEFNPAPGYYKETQQAFFHILLMLIIAMKNRCGMELEDEIAEL